MTIANLLKLNDSGVQVADYVDILADLTSSFKSIYGADAQIGESTKDGQWLASIALAIRDTGSMAASVYNNMNPNTATGDPFDRQLALLGLDRKTPTQSAMSIVVIVKDAAKIANTKFGNVVLTEPNNPGVSWVWDGNQPNSWVSWSTGTTVTWAFQATAYASTFGPVPVNTAPNVALQIGTVANQKDSIASVLTGTLVVSDTVKSVIAPVQYAVGNNLESVDAAKIRRAKSYANNANSVVRALEGKLATLPGVQDARIYENATDTTAYVTPTASMWQERNSILCMIRSPYIGTVNPATATVSKLVANTIEAKKSGGCGLSVGINNTSLGTPITVGKIKFVLAKPIPMSITLDVATSTSWSTALETLIIAAVTKYVGEVSLGQVVYEPDITCIVRDAIKNNGGGGAVAGATFIIDNGIMLDRWDGQTLFYGYPSPTITFRYR